MSCWANFKAQIKIKKKKKNSSNHAIVSSYNSITRVVTKNVSGEK